MNEQKLIKALGIRLEEKNIELAERDAEIIRLRAAVDLRDKTICANQTERNANAVKSAEKTKKIVLLREALETYREYTPEGTGVAEQALAATDDLKGCILCDAKPVGAVIHYGRDSSGRLWHGINWFDPNTEVPAGTKLFVKEKS